ncbi:hypothetical protein CHGG_10435 [Chaetomium globosum CBS 148.51]|uniref:Uncharacterized protein n=1 Tax=Chaetomium globosum (strain ATCC 6205 / CBS 148.51 / DSM 1962 / NBRC 6347 / NRRL 1970) TaxID=306901 RepID=Q2GNL9_CHAGB|nr:uncharacterized protein CHGG_10435 [Chaetomium globosum CBS 148.51]EAQ84031.1 hypothetical protein CHGG_10435 [Chaetomium globosum CBS 148.51]
MLIVRGPTATPTTSSALWIRRRHFALPVQVSGGGSRPNNCLHASCVLGTTFATRMAERANGKMWSGSAMVRSGNHRQPSVAIDGSATYVVIGSHTPSCPVAGSTNSGFPTSPVSSGTKTGSEPGDLSLQPPNSSTLRNPSSPPPPHKATSPTTPSAHHTSSSTPQSPPPKTRNTTNAGAQSFHACTPHRLPLALASACVALFTRLCKLCVFFPRGLPPQVLLLPHSSQNLLPVLDLRARQRRHPQRVELGAPRDDAPRVDGRGDAREQAEGQGEERDGDIPGCAGRGVDGGERGLGGPEEGEPKIGTIKWTPFVLQVLHPGSFLIVVVLGGGEGWPL